MKFWTDRTKNSSGLRGERIAYIIWGIAIVFILLFRVVDLFLVAMGLYLYLFRHSRDHVCPACKLTKCTECSGELTQHNFCKSCSIVHCPYCNHHQVVDRSVIWVSAIFILLIAPLIVIIIFVLSAFNILLFMVAYFFYEGLSSSIWNNCNKRILISSL